MVSVHLVLFLTNFYPRPPRGGRLRRFHYYCFRYQFLSTPSARRATAQGYGRWRELLSDFYPRPPRGGRPRPGTPPADGREISIHALREEGDGTKFISEEEA